ncbi:nitroreductase family protein [Geomobilimonas luticola]|uniref:Nitroreductase n=1 Tax=Geomobilimonas luticola TaxID=1114878 RepID=A0ABS5SBW3_9BACT|nr:nitroreductase [Geomobilimonas luticola]MBT0652858.1 nitroreductase [Geomobilimonas luticola]
MDILEAIRTRRSVREFTAEPVTPEQVTEILSAGRWAPSGLNNQPWRFVVVRREGKRQELAALTKYRRIIDGAPLAIAVFCDREAMYNDTKDHQGAGACLQNMLLAVHGLGLGAVWLGEILNRSAEVNAVLELPARYELMAVLAVGHPASCNQRSGRKGMEELLLKEL